MNAKEYLLQLNKLDKMISNKLIELEQWKSIATGTTVASENERVMSSMNTNDKMAEAVVRYIEIEAEVNGYIDKLVDTKKEIISVIEQLPANEYDIIHKVYVQHEGIDEVVAEIDKSRSWVVTVHGQGLARVQRIINQ